ncbi:hypothetical protein SD37_11590 [Amycolatopsis orientalis]|uniref:Uncharacterized protein n=1 Tax=Amycolatopsis orientalis TaxID=31958 RepID=A0A193BVL5_AMYOR|nr:hypothetical protein [Amycolatopsis orientalis]ANN16220.1 hypothetical protein SD37_11590 [Amycolatopsis orientalis]
MADTRLARPQETRDVPTGNGQLHCITKDPREPAAPEFLEICDDTPVHLVCSRYCPDECGGHLICDPCFRLGIERGLIREVPK